MVAAGWAAVAATHEWFERHSGWSPPDAETLAEAVGAGAGRAPDDCPVAPGEACPHGLASWWLVLVCLDRPDRPDPMPPTRLVPDPARLDPAAPAYVAVMEAHHRAVTAGEPGYLDPVTGLFALTARTLWDRDDCCERGCRHCPFVGRGPKPGRPRPGSGGAGKVVG